MIENMSYSAERLLNTFPRHFTPTTAERWRLLIWSTVPAPPPAKAHNPEVNTEIADGGRLGNTSPPSTDGYVFRGAGLSQVTGRDGDSHLQIFMKDHGADFDILENPGLIIDPAHTLECGVADWIMCGCLPHAHADDIIGETKALNGGENGLAERRRQLALLKGEFGV